MSTGVQVECGKIRHRWKAIGPAFSMNARRQRWLVVYLDVELKLGDVAVKRTITNHAERADPQWEKKVQGTVSTLIQKQTPELTAHKRRRLAREEGTKAVEKIRRRLSAYLRKQDLRKEREAVKAQDLRLNTRESAMRQMRDLIETCPGLTEGDVVKAFRAARADLTVENVMES